MTLLGVCSLSSWLWSHFFKWSFCTNLSLSQPTKFHCFRNQEMKLMALLSPSNINVTHCSRSVLNYQMPCILFLLIGWSLFFAQLSITFLFSQIYLPNLYCAHYIYPWVFHQYWYTPLYPMKIYGINMKLSFSFKGINKIWIHKLIDWLTPQITPNKLHERKEKAELYYEERFPPSFPICKAIIEEDSNEKY